MCVGARARGNYHRHRQFRYRLASIKSTNCNKLIGAGEGGESGRRGGGVNAGTRGRLALVIGIAHG